MKTISINQLQAYSGIKAHTIRIWEKRYDLLQPQRNGGNIRGYSLEQTDAFLDIVLLNKNGYKISRLVGMTGLEREQKRNLLTDVESLAEKTLKDLLLAYLQEDITGIQTILTDCVKVQTPGLLISSLLLPFAERTGLLWNDHRHFTTVDKVVFEIVRRTLVRAMGTSFIDEPDHKTALLATVPTEQNNLSLLFAQHFLSGSGFRSIWLNEASCDDLAELADRFNPSIILTTATRKKSKAVFDEWQAALSANKATTTFQVLSRQNDGVDDNSSFLKSIEALACFQSNAIAVGNH